MRIFLNSSSNDPNYLQIENAIRSAICQGQLRPQDQLPSIRQLAKQLQVAIITVKRAYDDLEQAGMIETRQGKGCFSLSAGCSTGTGTGGSTADRRIPGDTG